MLSRAEKWSNIEGMAAPKALKEELAFYEQQKPELLKTHPGQYVLIKGANLIGIFPTQAEAYKEGFRRFGRASFLVKKVEEKEFAEQIPLLAMQIQRADL